MGFRSGSSTRPSVLPDHDAVELRLNSLAKGRNAPLSFAEAYNDVILLSNNKIGFENIQLGKGQADKDFDEIKNALAAFRQLNSLPKEVRKGLFAQAYLKSGYKAFKAIKNHPYMRKGREYHLGIDAYDAVIMVQDNAYKHIIAPRKSKTPLRALVSKRGMLQPRGDLSKNLVKLQKNTEKLEIALKKHNSKATKRATGESRKDWILQFIDAVYDSLYRWP